MLKKRNVFNVIKYVTVHMYVRGIAVIEQK